MADINTVSLVGRLTRDIEVRYAGELPVGKFGLANNYSKKTDGKWTEEANFFDIVLFGRQAESLKQYLVKGKQVAISGELRQERWEKDGRPQSMVRIIASSIQLLGGNATNSNQEHKTVSYAEKSKETYQNSDEFIEDIPF